MKDRTRQISQDMSIVNQQPTFDSVQCLEQIVKYLIVSQHDGMTFHEFDVYSNMKQITGLLGDLRDKQYKFAQEEELKNSAEMLAY